jgi:hypothetical protein
MGTYGENLGKSPKSWENMGTHTMDIYGWLRNPNHQLVDG